ncbi:MAG: HAD hydrolase-like protein [Desulfobacterales bacterium]|nr:MAG: HAD hydrolase-like protein [Desulfobacterales bacterium]
MDKANNWMDSSGTTDAPLPIEAVLFHLEATLLQLDDLDRTNLKRTIGCPAEVAVTAFLRSLPDPKRKKQVLIELEAWEMRAYASAQPRAETDDILNYLRSKDIRLGVLSPSGLKTVQRTLQNFKSLRSTDWAVIISREDLANHPTDAHAIRRAVQNLQLDPRQVLAVGAHGPEIEAFRMAGAQTVLLDRSHAEPAGTENDYRISRLQALKKIVRMGTALPTGKLPNDLLREFLGQFVFDDPSVLINPGIGEDTAAVDVGAEEVLVLKSDPITFATDSIGQYAVLINANDIATSGARPRWLLTTLLFPFGITAFQIRQVVYELKEFCQRWDITLCGGHTEITDAVRRPVIAGMMAGTVAKSDLIDKRNMAPGDRVLLTKGVAVEGTAIIAREFGDKLQSLGMPQAEIDICRNFLAHISIIAEARIAARMPGTSAMHDVTEGGLATALEELSIAGGHRIQIHLDRIPILPETRKICRLLDINPLGLIGSGSLLICCRQEGCENLIRTISATGTEITCIGEVRGEGRGIEALQNNEKVVWPCFEVDEITHLF